MTMATKFETRSASDGPEMKTNGRTTGSVEKKTRPKTPAAPSKSSPVRRGLAGGSGNARRPMEGLELVRIQYGCDALRQFVGDCLPGFGGTAGGAHSAKRIKFAATGCEAVHEIHDGVDYAPRQIAAQRPDEHLAHVRLAGAAHTYRTGKREHHNYTDQHLQHAVDGVEHPLESHSGKHGELPKVGVPGGDCGTDRNETVVSADLVAQSSPFQHCLKEPLRARHSEPDVTFAKFRDEGAAIRPPRSNRFPMRLRRRREKISAALARRRRARAREW
jgi:hypothetical protein